MVIVAGVRFKPAGKIYYFDPVDMDLKSGDNVIVETARGIEFGTLASDLMEIPQADIVQPLKPIIRLADEDDIARHEENLKKKEKSLAICQEKIDKHGLEMKPVDVEYTFDNSKVVFYFTADGRVDFRELVKDLASVFRMRIELRQIGVRDETKMMGGIGSCGRELCCHSWMSEFEPVSIKMAKLQNLSLNPIKISGICGRLMCCLQYENETYFELRKGMPDPGERITTPDGPALVLDVNILLNKINTRLILEEKDGEKTEKLSAEYYVYGKEDIKRSEKRRGKGGFKPGAGKAGKAGSMEDVDIREMSEEELERQAELED
ncbi:MAG: stage 0 sporulation family protein [Clostridiales bacterium]|nr:stage 0 sporulation family protein [Clostridiales bacterium]